MQKLPQPRWQLGEVKSPHLASSTSVVLVKDIPYVPNANRLQDFSIYLPKTTQTLKLVGSPLASLPTPEPQTKSSLWYVHIHGGAWRDPQLTSTSIESTAAHAFSTTDLSTSIAGVISINYTVSPYPTHPALPYDPSKGDHDDPTREAIHPDHVRDVLHAFQLLSSIGLTDGSYILSGHSCGACLACQATLQPPMHWGLESIPDPPRPAALLGLNGLYHLPALVHGLGPVHEHMSDEYKMFLGITFGTDESKWPVSSPAQFDPQQISARVKGGKTPQLVVLDHSIEDMLSPTNQTDRMQECLEKVEGMRVIRNHRCVGSHTAPWQEGYMIWDSLQDIIKILREEK